MDHSRNSGRRLIGAFSCLGSWLVVILGVGAVVQIGLMITEEPDLRSATADRPFAQITRDVHDSYVWSLAYSSDGTRLASATITGDVWLKEVATGRTSRILKGPIGSARSLGFSPDGRVLAVTGGERPVVLWDLDSATELAPLEAQGDQKFAAFSPDGTILAVGGKIGETQGSADVTLWDWKNHRRLAVLGGHSGGIVTLCFSRDGMQLAASDTTGSVTLWDVADRRERVRLRAHVGGGIALAFSPDGSRLATAGTAASSVRLWDTANGEPIGSVPASIGGVSGVGFSPDATILAIASAGEGTVSLWSLALGREVGALHSPGGSLRSLVIAPDGKTLATGGADGAVRTWDLASAIAAQPAQASE